MTTAKTLRSYLDSNGAEYSLVAHPRAVESTRIAQTAHISGEKLAKGVLLANKLEKCLAVIPATHKLDLDKLSNLVGKRLSMASETEISEAFPDCDEGAVPACGAAYGLNVYLDDVLFDTDDIYFEAGDHKSLIHLDRSEFTRLMPGMGHGEISAHA